MNTAYTFKIGGEAGFGIMSAGLVFSKIATRSGYFIFNYSEYPSLIRGGHNVMQTSVSKEPVTSQYKHTDFLLALNQETIDLHFEELSKDAGVLYDLGSNLDLSNLPKNVSKFGIPLLQIVKDLNGSYIMRNTVALGATLYLLGAELNHLKDLISEEFGQKHADVIEINHKAYEMGYAYAQTHYAKEAKNVLIPLKDKGPKEVEKIVLTGNEAVALGALVAGVGFVSIYPMTPTSNIMHSLAPHQKEYGFIYKQPEDEISAINMAIGASFVGVRSMVATSGGGFCLMAEGYGLAGITETPIVIIMGMRAGPATGLPTWSSQGDLRFVLHAHQDEFPRLVLAAGDVNEAFELTAKAFNLADKYQTPVVVLVDKYLCESQLGVDPFDTSTYEIDRGKMVLTEISDYKRYKLEDDGISPRSVPGTGNYFLANSDEHTEYGYSDESIEVRVTQMEKRMQKLNTCMTEDMEDPVLYGPKDAALTLVSWGSNKGPILEAMKSLKNVNYLHLTWLNPFPDKFVKRVLTHAKDSLIIECNYSGQLHGLIKEKTGVEIPHTYFRYDGRPYYPEEIIEKVSKVKKK